MDVLDIRFDYDSTKEYRDKYPEQCDCAYCRNYYVTFKKTYPKTSKWIERFGLDTNFALEIMPLGLDEKNNTFLYSVYYVVKGEIIKDMEPFKLEGLEIYLLKGSDSNNPCPNPHMEEPYILIEIVNVELPWVLEKEID